MTTTMTNTTEEIGVAAEIRSILRDFKFFRDFPPAVPSLQVMALVSGWNYATNPSAHRTDREWRACRRLAQYCDRRLQYRSGWRESESGRRYSVGQW
jgi:hypothetical protein